jgi:hypothetical protein
MRSIAFLGTAAAVLTATTLLAVPASAERVCHQVCDQGFCRSRCVERSDRLYMTTATETTTTTIIEALKSVDRVLTLMSTTRA